MTEVIVYQRTVYKARTSGRTFLTAKSAARSEAAALIKRKYPTERAEYDNVGCTYGGFHWQEDDRLRRVHERLVRLILKRMKASASGRT